MKFKIVNFGCKVNTYESTYLEEVFLQNNYIEASSIEDANVIVINTCSVTNVADSKCKKMIRRIRRENNSAVIIATGCSVQNNFEEYKNFGIDILVDNFHKSEIFNLYNEYLKTKEKIYKHDSNRKQVFEKMLLDKFTKHTRAFIKIQDGCDNFCSYCVIPLVRGSIRSKNFDDVISEAIELSNNGHQEIVLVGIHTGSYNSDGKDLVDLINEISKIDKIKNIRISSIEITELDEKFMDMLKHNSKVVDHLHVPLQSGTDEILKVMNRKYDTKYYENKINLIRSIRPDINITTDVIVGHPYETEELFDQTLDFCNKIGFGKIHVFPYSVRKNTAASIMPNQVSEIDKKKRSEKLIRLSDILMDKYENKFISKEMEVITEINHNGDVVGFTSNYIKVFITNSDGLTSNNRVMVKLIKRDKDFVYAEYIRKVDE
ncbi:MAG: tRNA (N(6)-L-threonylcarbamoyladenosine(37)-C(2))-methylthiotransferase MtaB [Bacilli bacterium]|nr:tRNA (N(6)-L-threonylcarbamoyladenosine(37)-C(2))-methylthiotransferase MtaB [Bacilli bacterium]